MESIPVREIVDVLVVGAGAAGSVIAAKTALKGKKVLVLEAGPERKLTDLESSQISARRLKWGGAHVEEQGNLKVGHAFNSGYGTGGSALHHYGVWLRLHENDFNVKSEYGLGLDWPIQYKDLQPYYDQIQTEVGISGDASEETWRPEGTPYPMPPLPVFPQGKILAKGFNQLNKKVAPVPLAINSRARTDGLSGADGLPRANRVPNERPACIYDGWCDAGCPTGALANPLVTYIPQAMSAGADIRHNASVSRVLHDASGRKAIGVEYHDVEGNVHQVFANQVVLSAFVIQTARILLNSASEKHPNGLSNSNDQLGRYLMTHPAQLVCGIFDEETQPHLGPTGGQLICQESYANKQKGDAFGSYQWLIANAVKPNDLLGFANMRPDIYGAELDSYMRKATRHLGQMNFVGEDIALPENRITLSENKDNHGVSMATATHSIGEKTRSLAAMAVSEGLEVFSAAGANEAWNGPTVGMHLMGGAVMGSDDQSSVCDSYGRCHELDNLYIAGPSVFPSSGAVNPTFTIHALALRTAEHMLKES